MLGLRIPGELVREWDAPVGGGEEGRREDMLKLCTMAIHKDGCNCAFSAPSQRECRLRVSKASTPSVRTDSDVVGKLEVGSWKLEVGS
jgi:hypothetical protein